MPIPLHARHYLLGLLAVVPLAARDWPQQANDDAKHDRVSVIFDGKSPNKLACDTTLRAMPDGSLVMVMLGGGGSEPRPQNGIYITRSLDQGATWSPMERVDTGIAREGGAAAQVPSELMVRGPRCTLFFSSHGGLFGSWKSWLIRSGDSCRTWSRPEPVPGRLHQRTFVRNHIVARDGRILVPFQHYVGQPPDVPVPTEHAKIRPFHTSNPRNGVLISADGGRT